MSGTGSVPHIWCTNGDLSSFVAGDRAPGEALCLAAPASMAPVDVSVAVSGRV